MDEELDKLFSSLRDGIDENDPYVEVIDNIEALLKNQKYLINKERTAMLGRIKDLENTIERMLAIGHETTQASKRILPF